MRISPKQLLQGLLYLTPIALLALASCGGGGGGSTTPPLTTATVPAAPTGVSATDATKCTVRIQVSWNAVTGAAGYNIYRDTASSVTATTPLNSATPISMNSYIDTDPTLSAGTNYYYKVTARNSVGESLRSVAASAVAPAPTACTNVGGSIQGSALPILAQVTTFAGHYPNQGYLDGAASTAQFLSPTAIATDGVYLYVADKDNDVIRKIAISSGAVSTVAGIATSPGSVDSINGTPQFNRPDGITIDPTGTTLYVSDTGNGSIRKIDLSTTPVTVTTLAPSIGIGSVPRGITIDQSGAYVYVADVHNHAVIQVDTTTGSLYTVTTALTAPIGITTIGTNLYVTDSMIGGNTGTISQITIGTWTMASGASGFNIPQGITSDGANLYVTNSGDHTVYKVDPGTWASTKMTGTIGTAGYVNGAVGSALFNSPTGITTDGSYLYVVDSGNNVIRKIQ